MRDYTCGFRAYRSRIVRQGFEKYGERLIERSGFARGHSGGNVGISTRHTLALVNRGGASTAELVALAHEIADGVKREFAVELVPEPVFVGHSW